MGSQFQNKITILNEVVLLMKMRLSRSRHQSAESTNETDDGEVAANAIDKAGAPENLQEFYDLNDLKLSGKAHKKRLRAKQKERSDQEVNAIVRKLGLQLDALEEQFFTIP